MLSRLYFCVQRALRVLLMNILKNVGKLILHTENLLIEKKLIIFFSTHYSRTFNNAIVLTVLLNRPTAFKIQTTLIRRGKWNSAPLSHIAKSHRFSLVFTNHCIHWNVLVRKFFGNLGVFKKKIIIITCGDGRTIARFQFTASEACSSSTTTTTSFQSIV